MNENIFSFFSTQTIICSLLCVGMHVPRTLCARNYIGVVYICMSVAPRFELICMNLTYNTKSIGTSTFGDLCVE